MRRDLKVLGSEWEIGNITEWQWRKNCFIIASRCKQKTKCLRLLGYDEDFEIRFQMHMESIRTSEAEKLHELTYAAIFLGVHFILYR